MAHKILQEKSGGESSPKQDLSRKHQSGRRQWSIDQKKQIIDEALSLGMSVSQVSRHYDLNANMIFRWMREMRRGRRSVEQKQRIVPVGMIGDEPPPLVARGTTIEIAFANGSKVKVFGDIGFSQFSALLDLVRGDIR